MIMRVPFCAIQPLFPQRLRGMYRALTRIPFRTVPHRIFAPRKRMIPRGPVSGAKLLSFAPGRFHWDGSTRPVRFELARFRYRTARGPVRSGHARNEPSGSAAMVGNRICRPTYHAMGVVQVFCATGSLHAEPIGCMMTQVSASSTLR